MLKLSVFSCALAVCLFASPVRAADAQNDLDSVSVDTVVTYLHENEAARNAVDLAMAPIKSRADLRNYLRSRHSTQSPLDALTPASLRHFLASLQFNENGITSFDRRDLEQELSPSQIYQVLALFGVQRDTGFMKHARIVAPIDRTLTADSWWPIGLGEDHDDYKCDSNNPHTCVKSVGSICTSNC
ncbi:MAG: hypothetical protein JSS28_11615 [Proteobacteria bacterium]|nr:hypothetical protein [Pseudomonadota bacterium]